MYTQIEELVDPSCKAPNLDGAHGELGMRAELR